MLIDAILAMLCVIFVPIKRRSVLSSLQIQIFKMKFWIVTMKKIYGENENIEANLVLFSSMVFGICL